MTWLTPMTALIAAAATVPLLVALYFLKLRRKEAFVSSTLLWKRAVRDLQVNAPFQRLRKNILLLLQLLAMLAALAALGGPVLRMEGGPARRYVILIDRSASMNADDEKPTRLDAAKAQARQLVESLRSRTGWSMSDQSDQAMIVAFDEHAKVMCNFTADKRQLGAAIDSVEPTDAPTSLAEALAVARAFAQPAGEAVNDRSSQTRAQVELFSDGRIADAETLAAAEGEIAFHRIGDDGKNLAITALGARRSYENPQEVEIFATLANYNEAQTDCQVQLTVDGEVRSVRAVQAPPARNGAKAGPGTLAISFTLELARSAVAEVRGIWPAEVNHLAGDDAAACIVPPPKSLRAMLVTTGNVPLASALEACPLAGLDICTPQEFDSQDQAANEARYDFMVLDRCSPAKLPRGRFLVFGKPPPQSGATVGEELSDQVVIDWRSRHPVLQFVNLGNLFVSKAWRLAPGGEATVLAEFSSSPALALVRREGSVYLLAPFDCLQTNWPFEPSMVMFCYNAASFLAQDTAPQQQAGLRVNQAISMENLPAGAAAVVTPPGGRGQTAAVGPDGRLRYPQTARAGVYRVEAPGRPAAYFAVNLLDENESRIEPARQIVLSGLKIEPQQPAARGNQELWPLLALVAMMLVCVEWLVYNHKVTF